MKYLSIMVLATAVLVGCATTSTPPAAWDKSDQKNEMAKVRERVKDSTTIYRELIQSSDSAIPESLVARSRCVAVLPSVLRAAFFAGGSYGKGIVSCRDEHGTWSLPSFVRMSIASVGFQIGADSTDLVLFFTGDQAQEALFKNNISLGGDLTITAGPVGRSADGGTDFSKANVYSYAKSQGLFAGISLEGSMLQPDLNSIQAFYGQELTVANIMKEEKEIFYPNEAKDFVALLP